MRSNYLRKIALGVSASSLLALIPISAANAYVSGCGSFGTYSACGNPSYVSAQLIDDMTNVTADMILNNTAYANQTHSNTYSTYLTELNANVSQPTAAQQKMLGNFQKELNIFRVAENAYPSAKAQELAIWDPTNVWAALTLAVQGSTEDFVSSYL